MTPDPRFMRLAIEACQKGIAAGQTPFGACIVRGDDVVAVAHNRVWETTDITAHAEIVALRVACAAVRGVDLRGCVIYSTTEPCPMCFSACHWANLDAIVYGADIADAAGAGFRELTLSNAEMKRLGGSGIEIVSGFMKGECAELFKRWMEQPGRRGY